MAAQPDFDLALRKHLDAIASRDLESFAGNLTSRPVLYTIVQNGHAFTTPQELAAVHAEWFKDPDWVWQGSVIHKHVGQDMALAVLKYTYRPNPGAASFETWLTYVFALENGAWKIIHDQNTALDYAAFAKAQA